MEVDPRSVGYATHDVSPVLSIASRPTVALDGETVLRDGARLLGEYLTRQLAVLPADDPDLALITAEASRFLLLADWRSPRMRDAPRV